MRITVFGATSRTGHHLLAEGVRRGHEVASRRPRLLVALLRVPYVLDIVEDSASVRTAINVSRGAHGAAA